MVIPTQSALAGGMNHSLQGNADPHLAGNLQCEEEHEPSMTAVLPPHVRGRAVTKPVITTVYPSKVFLLMQTNVQQS